MLVGDEDRVGTRCRHSRSAAESESGNCQEEDGTAEGFRKGSAEGGAAQ